MIKNNEFYIEKLKSVVFLGESKILDQLPKINSIYNLNTYIITSPDQAKNVYLKKDKKILNKNNKNIISSIKEGDRFYTPNNFIDISLSRRMRYNSTGSKFK